MNMDMLTRSSNCLFPRNFTKARAPSKCLVGEIGELVSSLVRFS